jgi:hypothetical protein
MRRRSTLIASVIASAALLAGCGGSGGESGAGSAEDARAVLAAIAPAAQEGPQRISVELRADLDGTLSDPSAAALVGDRPLSLTLSGPVDTAGKAADLTFDVDAGAIELSGGLRLVGDTGYLKVGDTWYALPADALSGTTSGSTAPVDPAEVLGALGDPAALIRDAVLVGTEDVDGIATDHVSGTVDTAELVAAIGRLAETVDAQASPVTPDQIAEATRQIEKYVTDATVDVWVGRDSKQVHRLRVTADIAFDGEAKESTGLDGVDVELSVSATPTDSPAVSAPAGARPQEELSKQLGLLLLGGLGAPTP